MKKLVLASFLGLMTSSVFAAEKTIEVCLIPLADIVDPGAKIFVGSLQHLFLRSEGVGQNFEPQDPMGFMGGPAKIGTQDYSTADCRVVYKTANEQEYQTTWKSVQDLYRDAAQNYQYSVAGKNCQVVTKEVMGVMNFSFPAEFQGKIDKQAACSIQ